MVKANRREVNQLSLLCMFSYFTNFVKKSSTLKITADNLEYNLERSQYKIFIIEIIIILSTGIRGDRTPPNHGISSKKF